MTRGLALVVMTVGIALGTQLAAPQRAQATIRAPTPTLTRAVNIPSPVCTVAGWFSGLAGTLCSVARKGGELLGAGGKLVGGAGTAAKVVGVAAVLAGLTAWVSGAAHAVLSATAAVIGGSTRPQLESSWFSASYWRMAAIGMLLTVPFLFAACVQGILRSDPSLIGRAALGYLPLAVLSTSIAAPLTTLLLSASDGLSTLIAGAAGEAPGAALAKLGVGTSALAGASGSTFIAFVVGFVTVAATLTLWVELLIRAAAVYVIVLMLPVVFAALVWPARRMWAIRSVETLVALILAKFAIVAVLSLGGAAIGHTVIGPAESLVGVTLVMLAAFSPWALLRLLPLHEMAAGVEGLGPQLGRRVPMLEGPSPQAGADASARAPESRPAGETGETVDAAQMIVGGLNGDGEPVTSSSGANGPAPADGGGAVGGEAAGQVADGDAGAGAAVDASAPSEAPDHRDGTQRLPGMGPMWQMRNGSWQVQTLGPEMVAADANPAPGSTPAPIGPQPPVGAVPAADDPVLAPAPMGRAPAP
ncbi:MAG: hypothetical protein M3022_07615, partial [Actinomycetota bacterium]|nr:hypothetical protein [Actinomycetota bacterium]